MKLPIKKIFVAFLFVIMFVGEVSFQISNNAEQTKRGLYMERQVELDLILVRSDVLAEKTLAGKRAEPFEIAKNQYTEINARAINKARDGERVVRPYDDSINAADNKITEAWKPYRDLVVAYQKPINEKYNSLLATSDGWLGKLTGVQYGVTASIMAIALSFFAVFFLNWRRHALLGTAFLAQTVASNLIRHGALLKYGDPVMAWGFFAMFLICTPLAYHFGIIIYHMEMPKQIETNFTFTTMRKNEKHGGIDITSLSTDATGFKKAIVALAQENAAGNGVGMLREIARHYKLNPGEVYRAKDRALNGKSIPIPRKLLAS